MRDDVEIQPNDRPYPYFMGGSVKVYPLHQLFPDKDPPRFGAFAPVMSEETRRDVAKYGDGSRPERQIYIHVPFCPAFCHFCILYKTMDPKQQDEDYRETFVKALVKEIEVYGASVPATKRQEVGAIYFGGGTPSQLTAAQVDRIMNTLRKHVPIRSDAEITFEGMPHQLKDLDYLRELRASGINRISYGIQTFQRDLRKQLGRIDTVEDIYECAENVYKSGIDELNVELLFGIPGMTMPRMIDDLEHTLRLNSTTLDIIYYNVTVGTQYYEMIKNGTRPPQLSGDDLLRLRLESVKYLEAHGCRHTSGEVFDRRGHRHDRFQEIHFGGSIGMDEILGFGPSSYGFLDGVVYQNVPSVQKYMELLNSGRFPLRTFAPITPAEARLRGIFFGLQLFRVRQDLVRSLYHKAMFRRWERLGLLTRTASHWEATAKGRNWYNMMQLDLVPPMQARSAIDLMIDKNEQARLFFNPEEKVGNVDLVRELEAVIEGPIPILRPLRRYVWKQMMKRSMPKVEGEAPKRRLTVIHKNERGQNAFTGS